MNKLYRAVNYLEVNMVAQLLKLSILCGLVLLLGACSSDSDEESILQNCVGIDVDDIRDFQPKDCDTDTLPFIIQENANYTIDDIMTRVITSEVWMRDNFEAVLQQMPDDLLTMFGVLTAIVIDTSVNPSFYAPGTSVIYIDPDLLWQTAAEHSTLEATKDYRGEFLIGLIFRDVWQYVDARGDAAWFNYSRDYSKSRDFTEAFNATVHLLMHELAHANDFYSYESIALTNPTVGTYPTQHFRENWVSQQLEDLLPLSSDELLDLAAVMFLGDNSTTEQRSYDADSVGTFLITDQANDLYNYASPREDLAMLFEEFTMLYFFNLNREILLIDNPTANLTCDDWQIGWGRQSLIQDAEVLQRAVFVATRILPEIASELQGAAELLSASSVIPTGENFCNRFLHIDLYGD